MSDLSEQIEAVVKKSVDEGRRNAAISEEGPQIIAVSDEEFQKVTGLDGNIEYCRVQTERAMQIVYRKHAGSKPFTEPSDALDRTKEKVMGPLTALVINAFADGIQMGQAQSFCYKKYAMFDRLNEVFNKKAWRSESDLIAMPFQTDYDCVQLFEHMVEATVLHLGTHSGYVNYTDPKKLNKIWDLWMLTSHSVCIGAYQAGVALGKEWIEKDTLAGIMAATQSESGD